MEKGSAAQYVNDEGDLPSCVARGERHPNGRSDDEIGSWSPGDIMFPYTTIVRESSVRSRFGHRPMECAPESGWPDMCIRPHGETFRQDMGEFDSVCLVHGGRDKGSIIAVSPCWGKSLLWLCMELLRSQRGHFSGLTAQHRFLPCTAVVLSHLGERN